MWLRKNGMRRVQDPSLSETASLYRLQHHERRGVPGYHYGTLHLHLHEVPIVIISLLLSHFAVLINGVRQIRSSVNTRFSPTNTRCTLAIRARAINFVPWFADISNRENRCRLFVDTLAKVFMTNNGEGRIPSMTGDYMVLNDAIVASAMAADVLRVGSSGDPPPLTKSVWRSVFGCFCLSAAGEIVLLFFPSQDPQFIAVMRIEGRHLKEFLKPGHSNQTVTKETLRHPPHPQVPLGQPPFLLPTLPKS